MGAHLLLALPEAVVSRVLDEARRREVAPESLIINLIAEELPRALSAAARDLLATVNDPQNETPPDSSDGVPDPHLPQFKVISSLAPGCDLIDEDSAGGSPR
jgi:hypothetical protein